jgi:bifunctional non-homologous end joining protein LigD
MLATLVPEPFSRDGWAYEEKYDGDRTIAYKEGDHVQLLSRNANDRTADFPKIVAAIRDLSPETLLLDGEVVVFDSRKVSRFQLLQQGKADPVYAVFDCLYRNGRDLRRRPLSSRRLALEESLIPGKVLRPSRRLSANGLKAFAMAKARGFEGIVAKDLSSPYLEKRSMYWLKVKVKHEDEFVIGGFTEPAGSRKYFGALLLGAYQNRELRYVGKVGTGFDEKTLAQLNAKFRPLLRKQPAFIDPPRDRKLYFLAPHLVAQIAYSDWTADHKLRHPVYLGLRNDKRAADVSFPEART